MKKQQLKILKINYKWFIAGIFLLLLGYIILSLNGNAKTWDESIYAFHKITLAPILLIIGYVCVGCSIMLPRKSQFKQ
jgi:uncharacterized BrkB/YihY/UPF0761 family membrane protein